eukprot:3593175-Amphidinium_carterae.1
MRFAKGKRLDYHAESCHAQTEPRANSNVSGTAGTPALIILVDDKSTSADAEYNHQCLKQVEPSVHSYPCHTT